MPNTAVYSFFFFLFLSVNIHARELLIWTSNEDAASAIALLKKDFEKDFKCPVVVEVLNKDLTALFKTAALTGKGPDILLWANDVSGELAQSGLIEPLDELPFLKEHFLPVSLTAFKYKGRLYGYPYAVESVVLFYNPTMVKHPPLSFEELESVALKINNPQKKTYGFLFDFKNFYFSFPLLSANGGYVFGEDQKGFNPRDVGLNHPGFVSGLTFLQKLSSEGLIPSSTDQALAFFQFKEGRLAFTIDGPWAIKELEVSKTPYKIAVLPRFKGETPKPFVGVHGFMLRRSSQNKRWARELIEKYFLSPKGMATFYEYGHRAPARKDVLLALGQKNEQVAILEQSAASGVAMPNIPEMGPVWSAMKKALSLSLEQKVKAKESLELAAKEVKK